MTRRVGVERMVAQLRQYTKLGVAVVERQEVINLLRRELAKRDARVRRAINKCSIGNSVNKADLLAAIGRKWI